MDHPAKPKDRDHLRDIIDRLEDDSFDEWRVEDGRKVDLENFSSLDEALEELQRRLWKGGHMEHFKDSLRYEKPSAQRRAEREAQAHRAKSGAERRWRGGVRD